MDTQWPRWEVFKQDTPSKPHQAVGSVHAADPFHALLTARNVFARRPQAVSMWVAPASAIFSVTKEELAEGQELKPSTSDPKPSTYYVFRKTSHKRSMTFVDYVGELEATSPEEALKLAMERFTDAPAMAWWVVPASSVTKSEDSPETVESWFAPAKDKTYKQQSYYGLVGAHPGKHKRTQGDDDE
ncbi:phenylacetic acid degradation protein [Calidithermus timidus]|jgi:ring-1,2-phenylacetyl-CoA epoxidase subunit PaaB|uniref:phenylacetic acid degradation protein n=1 Tax=Calidithermus timidus TaxID=307124 RepID=UPI00037DF9DD|nr:phenylacetic acid degradation protein [Calidithermus timidus]